MKISDFSKKRENKSSKHDTSKSAEIFGGADM
jgi:hypothetical protein